MPVVKEGQWRIDRPKWAIIGLMRQLLDEDALLQHLPPAFVEDVRFMEMVHTDLIDLDLLDETALARLVAFLRALLASYEQGRGRAVTRGTSPVPAGHASFAGRGPRGRGVGVR
ncbi:hypothetical protein [Deinococcus pimensis]|uniref:hypothetical protein n=1 Tax=Deinococcus pimensis TaxID=309888 RepID=UPI000485FBAF|nr:hypothetical protein [Deinococcus pimensis]